MNGRTACYDLLSVEKTIVQARLSKTFTDYGNVFTVYLPKPCSCFIITPG